MTSSTGNSFSKSLAVEKKCYVVLPSATQFYNFLTLSNFKFFVCSDRAGEELFYIFSTGK